MVLGVKKREKRASGFIYLIPKISGAMYLAESEESKMCQWFPSEKRTCQRVRPARKIRIARELIVSV